MNAKQFETLKRNLFEYDYQIKTKSKNILKITLQY